MQPQATFTLSYLAKITESQLRGDPNCEIHGIAPLEKARSGEISFLNNSNYLDDLENTKASAVILSQNHLNKCSTNALIHENPLLSYTKLVKIFFASESSVPVIHPSVIIGKNCKIDPTVSIGAYCVIGNNVSIGKNTVIHPGVIIGDNVNLGNDGLFWSHVTVYHGVTIGNGVIIHSGAVIGSDGFGNVQHKGTWVKVPQIGGALVGNDVEIGANTTIDRGTIEDTIIGNGVRIDNQVQIAHNVHIGDHTAIAACAGIAGSAKIGKNCMIGGSANIIGHIKIADNTVVAGDSNIARTIDKPDFYLSSFYAVPHLKWKKNMARFQQLDELAKRLFKLEKEVCGK